MYFVQVNYPECSAYIQSDMYSFVAYHLQAIDFLDKLLRYDHQDRVTAKEAMVIKLLEDLYLSYY